MLVEEIERLNIDLWHARTDVRVDASPVAAVQDAIPEPVEPVQRGLPPPLPAY